MIVCVIVNAASPNFHFYQLSRGQQIPDKLHKKQQRFSTPIATHRQIIFLYWHFTNILKTISHQNDHIFKSLTCYIISYHLNTLFVCGVRNLRFRNINIHVRSYLELSISCLTPSPYQRQGTKIRYLPSPHPARPTKMFR